MAKLPLVKRIQDAVDKIGTVNGTAIPDATLPSDIKRSDNVAVNAFFDQHKIMKEYLIVDTIKRHIEGRHKRVRSNLFATLGIDETKIFAGDTRTFHADNVNLTYKANNGQMRLDKATLLTILMTKHKMSLEVATEVISAAEKPSKPPLILTPATTAE